MELIDLDNNQLKSLPKDLFKDNRNLKYIRLQNNRLTILDPQIFAHLPQLNMLNLTGNSCINKSFVNPTKELIEYEFGKCNLSCLMKIIGKVLRKIERKFYEIANEIEDLDVE